MDGHASRNEMVWVVIGVFILLMVCLCAVIAGGIIFFGFSPLMFFRP